MSTVREAMVSNPGQLPANASAQAAGELLQRPEVRAVYVTEDERLVGVVTRKTLVREVIALGLDPTATELRSIAEAPHFTIGPDVPLEEAFRFLETEDAERVPGRGRAPSPPRRPVAQRPAAAARRGRGRAAASPAA